MTWFRCGGSGIPAALKSQMNDVLNKKFGTSIDYPPNGWPDDVNLMGPLPEGTATGPIASISDGADRVPVKSWNVNIDPNLTGKSAVVATQGGKNLMSAPIFSASTDSLCVDFGFDITVSSLTISFLATASEVDNISSAIVDFRKNDGTHYYRTLNDFKDSNNVSFLATAPNNGVFKYTLTSRTFRYLYVSYTSGTRSKFTSDSLSNWQLEVGSTATTYEPYTAPTVSTVNLGRTIYGGTAGIVNGTGKETYIKYVIDGVNVFGYLTGSNNMNIMPYGLNIDGTISKWLCDAITASGTNFGYNSSQGFIFIRQAGWSSLSGVTDAETFNAYCQENPITLILPLARPTDFTFTPITPTPETALGTNNFWADEGDTTVVYRRDIDLALQAVSSSRGLMMASRPVTQLIGEQADLDQVNELNEETENTEEQEGEQDAR